MKSKSGEIILALMVGLTCAGIGMAALTRRHNAVVIRNQEIGVNVLALTGKRAAVRDNPGKTAAVIAASIAAGIAADKIQIGDNYTYITEGK